MLTFFFMLFIPQGVDRVEPRGLPGRVVAEDDAHRHGDDKRGQDGVDGHFRGPVEEGGDQERYAPSQEDAGNPAAEAEQDGLHQELPQDVTAPGADGHAQADLPGALGDRHQHDVHDAHAAHHQGNQGHHQEQLGHHGGGGGQGPGHLGHVPDAEVVGVAGLDAVALLAGVWVICWMAAGISGVERAAAMIWSTLLKRTGSGVSACWVADCSG